MITQENGEHRILLAAEATAEESKKLEAVLHIAEDSWWVSFDVTWKRGRLKKDVTLYGLQAAIREYNK